MARRGCCRSPKGLSSNVQSCTPKSDNGSGCRSAEALPVITRLAGCESLEGGREQSITQVKNVVIVQRRRDISNY